MSVASIIFELERTSSKNEKQDILKANKEVLGLAPVLFYAYNPRLKYFVDSKIDNLEIGVGVSTLEDTLPEFEELLAALSSQKYTGDFAVFKIKEYLDKLDVNNATIAVRTIKKDLRCGISETSINKVFSSLIPEYPYLS